MIALSRREALAAGAVVLGLVRVVRVRAGGAAAAIAIDNFAFTPASLTVPAGTKVTWTNHDEEPHTVVANDGSFHSPGMGSQATFSYTFAKAGTFDYVCSIHPFMHATVVVTQ